MAIVPRTRKSTFAGAFSIAPGNWQNLTAGDYEYLQPLGIRLVCDFRADDERSHQATHWPGDAPEFLSTPDQGTDASGRNTRIAQLRKALDRPGYSRADACVHEERISGHAAGGCA